MSEYVCKVNLYFNGPFWTKALKEYINKKFIMHYRKQWVEEVWNEKAVERANATWNNMYPGVIEEDTWQRVAYDNFILDTLKPYQRAYEKHYRKNIFIGCINPETMDFRLKCRLLPCMYVDYDITILESVEDYKRKLTEEES